MERDQEHRKKVVNAANKYIVKPIVNTVKQVVNTVAKVVKPVINTVTSWFAGSSGGGNRAVYPSNFVGPLPVGAVRASSSGGSSYYGSSGSSYSTASSASMASTRIVWYGNQAYNLNDSTQYAQYVKKVNIDYTKKRAAARIKKQCESTTNLKTSNQRIKENLNKVLGKPVGGYYTINGVKVPESQVLDWANGKTGSSTPSWLDQVFKGSYSNKTSGFGTFMEIVAGGIPIVGDIGDIRDAVHGIQTGNWKEVGVSGLGFIPIVGGVAKETVQAGIKETAQNTAKETAQKVDPNKLTHIFGKAEHNLDGFLKKFNGNKEKAYLSIENATQSYVNKKILVACLRKLLMLMELK
ncbi:hypothetical protein FL863_06490 [Listeria monocytogenes]|nr:hypothetical protein [Listeria monocytogenes]